MKDVVKTENAPKAIGPYTQGILSERFIFVSGQLPINPVTGTFPSENIKELTRQSLYNIKAILEEAGSSMDKIVKTTIFLTNMDDFVDVNSAYAEFFNEAAPARSCVEVSRLPKNAVIEIEAIAIQ